MIQKAMLRMHGIFDNAPLELRSMEFLFITNKFLEFSVFMENISAFLLPPKTISLSLTLFLLLSLSLSFSLCRSPFIHLTQPDCLQIFI